MSENINPPRSNLIISASDANCGDFVVNHWLASLKDNVDLSNIEVAILDYGLRPEQRKKLEEEGVICIPCNQDGLHIVWSRFRDVAKFLRERSFQQVLQVDGGDIIFQSDISHLFSENPTQWRAACEEVDVCFHDVFMKRDDFGVKEWEILSNFLKGKPVINGGFILGPPEKFQELWLFFQEWAQTMKLHGGDQFLCNYLFYKNGFVQLDKKYNFVLLTSKRSSYRIKKGIVYNRKGKIIPVVHNAGQTLGLIDSFGYGNDHNKINYILRLRRQGGLALTRWRKKLGMIS